MSNFLGLGAAALLALLANMLTQINIDPGLLVVLGGLVSSLCQASLQFWLIALSLYLTVFLYLLCAYVPLFVWLWPIGLNWDEMIVLLDSRRIPMGDSYGADYASLALIRVIWNYFMVIQDDRPLRLEMYRGLRTSGTIFDYWNCHMALLERRIDHSDVSVWGNVDSGSPDSRLYFVRSIIAISYFNNMFYRFCSVSTYFIIFIMYPARFFSFGVDFGSKYARLKLLKSFLWCLFFLAFPSQNFTLSFIKFLVNFLKGIVV